MYSRLIQLKSHLRGVAVALAAAVMVFGNLASVRAAPLSSGSIELGDPRTGQTTTYTSALTGVSGTNIGCVTLDLGSASDGSGAISGLDTSGATLDAIGISGGSWTVDNGGSANHVLQAETTTPAAGTNGSLVFGSIDNGDTVATTYYGVLNTYTDNTCVTGVDTITMAFIYKDGELVQLTIDPSLSFTCVAVAGGQSVNGATTTTASSPSGIDYSTGTPISSSQNGISAHDLTVTTNAAGGYNVYLRETGNLANANGDFIDDHTGSNATPTAFSAAGTEAWGYTTEDATLGGGTADRFTTVGNVWAAFDTSNEIVMDNTTATATTDTVRVGHQAGIATNTPAGTYQTTLIYTIVATY